MLKNRARVPWTVLALTLLGVATLPAASAASAQLSGRLSFVDDQGDVLIDLGDDGNGWMKYGVKLYGIKAKDGLADAMMKLAPVGLVLRVQIVKAGALPQVLLFNGSVNINEALKLKGFK